MRSALGFVLGLYAVVGLADTPAALQVADLDGVEIHHQSTGSGEPVVLIHGSLADYRYWVDADQVAPLASRFRVINYSRRFNYPNDNPAISDHSAAVEARDLAALLDALDTGPVHLVGHSYGAYTALLFALEHPDRVRSLVLAEPPILPLLPDRGEGFIERVWAPLAKAFEDGDAAGLEFTAQWYFRVPFAEVEPAWQRLFRDNVAEWRALAVSTDPFPTVEPEKLRALAVPVLLVSGGKNAGGFNDAVDTRLTELLPDVRRVVIRDAGHEMFQDSPACTVMAIKSFLSNKSGPPAVGADGPPQVTPRRRSSRP